MACKKKHKLLILSKGLLQSVENNIHFRKQKLFSMDFYGDIIHLIFNESLVNIRVDEFRILGCYIPRWIRRRKILYNSFYIACVVKKVLASHKEKKYDLIITREPIFSGVLGLVLSKLIAVPILVEMNGNYASGMLWTDKSITSWVKEKYTKFIIPFVLNRVDGVKVLYKEQLAPYGAIRRKKGTVWQFHDYIPMDDFEASILDEGYILAMGSPWKLKGYDILIEAFKKITLKHPQIELRIITWFVTEKSKNEFLDLISEISNIKLIPPVFYKEAIKHISRCKFLVLPSRTEGMGRVLLEAMGHQKAVIGSNVDGIPTYIEDHKNGLLFESENINELAEKMNQLINNESLRDDLAKEGRERAVNIYSEAQFYLNYKKMVESIIQNNL